LLCDRVIILLNGEVRADARLAELAGGADAILVLETAGEAVADQLAALPGVAGVTPFTTAASYPAFPAAGGRGRRPDARRLRPGARTGLAAARTAAGCAGSGNGFQRIGAGRVGRMG
jgi:hypothetical protein